MLKFTKLVTAAALSAFSVPAFAAMGTLNCANGDGSLRRTEQEVWGANVVEWTYQGKKIDQSQISAVGDPVVINEEVRFNQEFGEERVLENVQKIQLTLGDEGVSTFVLCYSLTYPNAYD